MKDSYTKKEVAEITGLPYRNIQFYTEQGVVVPIENAGGRGKFRRYSSWNLVSFLIAGELSYYGMTVGEIKNIVQTFNKIWKKFNTKRGVSEKTENALKAIVGKILLLSIAKGRGGTTRFEISMMTKNQTFSFGQWINGKGEKLFVTNSSKNGELSGYKDTDGNELDDAQLKSFWGDHGTPMSGINVNISLIAEQVLIKSV
jgi:DNA-binding transcriptional MerR regulator